MKKCSTAILMKRASKAACTVLLGIVLAQAPVLAAQQGAVCDWAPDAPDEHRVQRGDTLWAIASVFLKNPWCWPRVWDTNRDSIRDPHWIYPGQRILLDRVRGVLRFGESDQDRAPQVRWSPSVRTEALQGQRIPVISEHLMRMLAHTRLLDNRQLGSAPVIIGMAEGRKLAAEGDPVFVRGELGGLLRFDVIRPSAPIIDPDSHEVLGMVGKKVGRARLASRGTLSHRFVVTSSDEELQPGDRLVPETEPKNSPASIHASRAPAGKLAGILHEGRWAGPNDIVVLNRGADQGLDAGSVVRVARHVRIRADETLQTIHDPEEAQSVALLLVLGVSDRISVAVVMRSRDTVTIGDMVLPP